MFLQLHTFQGMFLPSNLIREYQTVLVATTLPFCRFYTRDYDILRECFRLLFGYPYEVWSRGLNISLYVGPF